MALLDELDNLPLPTHLSMVLRRLRVTGVDNSADTFLIASYIAEAAIKTVVITIYAGMKDPAPEVAYRIAHELVRSDGLGSWDRAFREMTTPPFVNYLPQDFRELVVWASKKRTKPEDEWFASHRDAAGKVLEALGQEVPEINRQVTVRDLLSLLVQIRNKTKAHGAVGQDFFQSMNQNYMKAVAGLISHCPVFAWKWLYLNLREQSSEIRAIALSGDKPRHLSKAERVDTVPKTAGIYIGPRESLRLIFCGDLLISNHECSTFFFPNGGSNESGEAEFIDYSSGNITRQSITAFQRVPAPLPSSETEGLSAIGIQSNVFGNLPRLPQGYVQRASLQDNLKQRLQDKNHHIITLHGPGGVGKTSLALFIALDLSDAPNPPFEHILWFSARDIDLRPTGPIQVRPDILDVDQIAKSYGRLMETPGTIETLAQALETSSDNLGTLFIFDNFETIRDVKALYSFLDTHTRLPNKILITSRERQFKADYPIEVRGMEKTEADQMLRTYSRELSVEGLLTPSIIESIYSYCSGHAYMMRVLLAEMAKEGKPISPLQVLGQRVDVADAVFERSFNKLSESGRSVFLTIAGWRSLVSELALLTVLTQRGIDVSSGIDECQRLSLLHSDETENGLRFLSMPLIAREYAERKLQGDPDRLLIQTDIETIRKFGAISATNLTLAMHEKHIARFLEWARSTANSQSLEERSTADRALERLAEYWPSAWLSLAEYRESSSASAQDTDYAYRRAVEMQPYRKEAWISRAKYLGRTGDEDGRISSLIAAVDADPKDVPLIREVAFQLCQFINAHADSIPRARRGVYLASVRNNMNRLSAKLDATGLSRLAWLYLLENDSSNALKYAKMGLSKEPSNEYCQNLVSRLTSA